MNLIRAEFNKIKKEIKFYYPDYIVRTVMELLLLLVILKLGDNLNSSYFAYVSRTLISGIISESVMCISTEKQLGTLQNLMTKPYTIFEIIFAKVLVRYILNLLKILFISLLLKFFLFPDLLVNIEIIVTLILESIGIFGLAFIMSSLTLIYTKTASFETIISYAILLLSGEIISLPDPVFYTNPISYFSIVIRKILTKEAISSNLALLFGLSLILLIIGCLVFKLVFRKSKDFSRTY